MVNECRAPTLKFMKGPRFWLHGKAGHAYFQAKHELGYPATPTCVEVSNLQMCYSGLIKHVPDFETKRQDLNFIFGNSSRELSDCSVISSSPYANMRILHDRVQKVGLQQALVKATPVEANKIVYDMFFKDVYEIGAAIKRLEEVYRHRWCKPHLLSSYRPSALACSAARNLRWLAKRVPPRVHIANTRFQFNGWHTGRKYEKRDTPCYFEHLLCCPAVQAILPGHLKRGTPARVPIESFFLHGLDGRHRVVLAIILYAYYMLYIRFITISDTHTHDRRDFKLCVQRTASDIQMRLEVRRALHECLGWH